MEIGVALAALGALYTIANHEDKEKEGYRTGYHISNDYDHHSQRLPNTNTRIKNYPVERKQDLLDDPNYYANPNSSVDKMRLCNSLYSLICCLSVMFFVFL